MKKTSKSWLSMLAVTAMALAITAVPAHAAALKCKTGFKPGKTPVSLAAKGKVACVSVKLATTGKKLFTGYTHACFTCHAPGAPYPVTNANNNLRTQGYTLAPAQITAAFNAHAGEMQDSTITAADAKAISAYLQTLK